MSTAPAARPQCVYCKTTPQAKNAYGYCSRCHDEFRCYACRRFFPGKKPVRWCWECREGLAAWRALFLSFGFPRPDAAMLRLRVVYYHRRARNGLPLFSPNPSDVDFASCAPVVPTTEARGVHLNGSGAALPENASCTHPSANYREIKRRRLDY